MLYAVCHKFINLIFEGDELYTVIGKRCEASDSEGWTAVIMGRTSRFIVEQRCGKKDEKMFTDVMATVVDYIKQKISPMVKDVMETHYLKCVLRYYELVHVVVLLKHCLLV